MEIKLKKNWDAPIPVPGGNDTGEGLFSVGYGGVDVFRSEEVLLEESLKQDAAHFAGAEDGDVEVGDLCGGLRGLNGYLSHGFPSGSEVWFGLKDKWYCRSVRSRHQDQTQIADD